MGVDGGGVFGMVGWEFWIAGVGVYGYYYGSVGEFHCF